VDGGDRLLLGWLQGADQAGLYAVGHDLPSYGVAMLMVIIYLAAYPLVVQALERQGPAAAAVQLRGYLVLLLVVAVPAVVL
jgi:predicted acyltransferase